MASLSVASFFHDNWKLWILSSTEGKRHAHDYAFFQLLPNDAIDCEWTDGFKLELGIDLQAPFRPWWRDGSYMMCPKMDLCPPDLRVRRTFGSHLVTNAYGASFFKPGHCSPRVPHVFSSLGPHP